MSQEAYARDSGSQIMPSGTSRSGAGKARSMAAISSAVSSQPAPPAFSRTRQVRKVFGMVNTSGSRVRKCSVQPGAQHLHRALVLQHPCALPDHRHGRAGPRKCTLLQRYFLGLSFRLITAAGRESKELRVLVPLAAPLALAVSS